MSSYRWLVAPGARLGENVVTVQSRFEGVREAGQLATNPADPPGQRVHPQLRHGAQPAASAASSRKARHPLVERSFGRYLASLDLVEEEETLSQPRLQLGQLEGCGDVPWEDFEEYEKLRGRLREERRLLRILQQQAEETLANELTLALQFASTGTLVSLKSTAAARRRRRSRCDRRQD